MNGKRKCEILKAIRKKIAEENGIPYESPECTYQGSCKGYCPACDAEARYLERALAARRESNKEICVVGAAEAYQSMRSDGNESQDTVREIPGERGYFRPIEELSLSPRTVKCLQRDGIALIGQLAERLLSKKYAFFTRMEQETSLENACEDVERRWERESVAALGISRRTVRHLKADGIALVGRLTERLRERLMSLPDDGQKPTAYTTAGIIAPDTLNRDRSLFEDVDLEGLQNFLSESCSAEDNTIGQLLAMTDPEADGGSEEG